jgi:hypothetical protein
MSAAAADCCGHYKLKKRGRKSRYSPAKQKLSECSYHVTSKGDNAY